MTGIGAPIVVSTLSADETKKLARLRSTVGPIWKKVNAEFVISKDNHKSYIDAKITTLAAKTNLKTAQDQLLLEKAKLNNMEAFLARLKNAAVSGSRIEGGGIFGFSFGSLILIAVLVLLILIVIYFAVKYFFPFQSDSKNSNSS